MCHKRAFTILSRSRACTKRPWKERVGVGVRNRENRRNTNAANICSEWTINDLTMPAFTCSLNKVWETLRYPSARKRRSAGGSAVVENSSSEVVQKTMQRLQLDSSACFELTCTFPYRCFLRLVSSLHQQPGSKAVSPSVCISSEDSIKEFWAKLSFTSSHLPFATPR